MSTRKILVSVKRVPDYAAKAKVKADGSGIVTEGIKWVLNPFDEIAVEEALRIKEARADVEIIVVSIGPADTTEQIRTALAMGADRAILVRTDTYVDSDAAARCLAALVQREPVDLIIMGKQSVDSDANQTGQLLAQSLGVPQATFASKVVLEDNWQQATVTREVDGGLETIKVGLPVVITTDLRLNEPRYPSLPGIVKAKKKTIEEVTLESLGVTAEPKVKIRKLELPPARKGGGKVGSVTELVEKLKNEAKII